MLLITMALSNVSQNSRRFLTCLSQISQICESKEKHLRQICDSCENYALKAGSWRPGNSAHHQGSFKCFTDSSQISAIFSQISRLVRF